MKTTPATTVSRRRTNAPQAIALTFLASVMLTQIGCLGVAANLMHAVGADMVPAEFDGLKDCNVAIVTATESTNYKDDVSAQMLSKSVGAILTQKVKDVRLIRHSKVEEWRDQVGWDNVDYVALGKAVEADKVISIELNNLKLREGATLYRGNSDVVISVLDVATGTVVYTREIEEYTFPRSAGQHVSETDENRFRKVYLGMLAKEIGRSFHPYDLADTFALDAAIASQ